METTAQPGAMPPDGAPASGGRTGLAAGRALMPWLVAAVGAVALGLLFRDCFVDDAYIGFRYIDNLLHGHGLVFNPGERVEGVTNLGWLLLLAPFSLVLDPPLAAKLLGGLLLAATAGLAALLTERMAGSVRGLGLLAALLVLTRFEVSYFSLAGMETALAALLMLAVVWLSLEGRHPVAIAALSALAFLARPETVVVLPIATVLLLGRGQARLSHLLAVGTFAALVALITIARLLYFGDPLPNTFRAKTPDLMGAVASLLVGAPGATANFVAPFGNLLVLAVVGLGIGAIARRSVPAAAMAAGVILAGGAFALYAEPDWTGLGRYFAPYAPVAIVLLLAGCLWLEERLTAARRATKGVGTAFVGAGLIVLGAIDMLYQGSPGRLQSFPGYVMAGRSLVGPARWIGENLAEDALVATRRIGAVAYFGRRPVLDYSLGLTDRRITELVRTGGSRIWSPTDPRLRQLWQARPPDALLEDSDVIDRLLVQDGGTRARFEVHGIAYRVVQRFPVGERTTAGLFGPETQSITWDLARRITQP